MEERLEGGLLTSAVRIGATVRRAAGPWTDSVHALLRHVRERGIDFVPEPLGRDGQGREILSFLEGEVHFGALPAWIWADEILRDAASMLRRYHDATLDFSLPGRTWRFPERSPAEVVCHNDWVPYNMVFSQRRLTGIIDWDVASPGPRLWDLAYLAYRLVPLAGEWNMEALPTPPAERVRRLDFVLGAYGADSSRAAFLDVVARRLDDIAAFTEGRARGEGPGSQFWTHLALYEADAAHARAMAREAAAERGTIRDHSAFDPR